MVSQPTPTLIINADMLVIAWFRCFTSADDTDFMPVLEDDVGGNGGKNYHQERGKITKQTEDFDPL